MNLKFFSRSILLSITLGFAIHAQATPPQNLSISKKNVTQYYVNGDYDKDVKLLIDNAEQFLLQRIGENNNAVRARKLAVVLDIDDTSLSNYPNYKKNDFGHTYAMITKSFREANAPAIKPVLDLFNTAVRNNVKVFFITRRPELFRNETIKNLQDAGYAGWKALFLPNEKQFRLPAEVFKTSVRKRLTQEGYHIVLNIGDQDSDLKGGYAERTVKLPNPLY